MRTLVAVFLAALVAGGAAAPAAHPHSHSPRLRSPAARPHLPAKHAASPKPKHASTAKGASPAPKPSPRPHHNNPRPLPVPTPQPSSNNTAGESNTTAEPPTLGHLVVGGYACVPNLTDRMEVQALAELAAEEYMAGQLNATLTAGVVASAAPFPLCDDYTVNLTRGCSKVVKGTEYLLDFVLTCPSLPSTKPMTLRAVAFVPLPLSDDPPQVDAIEILDA